MARVATILRLALLFALASVLGFSAPVFPRDGFYNGQTGAAVALADLPSEAQQTLQLIKRGGPFPYPHKDGSTFGNYEKMLPQKPRGYYHEYTVPTPGRSDRGARRIIAGTGRTGNVATSGEYFYTADHYRSFRRIEVP